ncbi:hypothetical protein F5X98DRAFT_368529 [Xylaria grammica]|nr:hypothetical protein F5X98DRAFT_368529 [Xylaria grammica]
MASFFVPRFLLPYNSVHVGRFVTQIDQPQHEFHDPPPPHRPRSLVSNLDDITRTYQTNDRIQISTKGMKAYTLENSGDWFENVIKSPTTRNWIERAINRGEDLFMIVGFYTVIDANISIESITSNGINGAVQAPVGLSLAAVGVVLPLETPLDSGIEIQQEEMDSGATQYVVPGEQVCAVQYRKLCHKWLSSKRVDNARLSRVHYWHCTERSRDEEDGVEDIIEVELTGADKPGTGWNESKIGDDVIFICEE